MDIDSFILGISFEGGVCSLASPGFTSYYRGLLKSLGQLTEEEFALCSILNFSAQQLSNRTARSPMAHGIAHFTRSPEPFFSAMILKLVGYTEVHFLPIDSCDSSVLERIRRNALLNDATEIRGPYLHQGSDIHAIRGRFGLIHLIDSTVIPGLEGVVERLSRFTDIVTIGTSLEPIIHSLASLEYRPFVQRTIGSRQVAVLRRTRLPGSREYVEA